MLQWLETLPPSSVYLVLALLALVENVVPPVPADAAVALGAFLSHRGITSPLMVFLVVWVCNVGGAAAVYGAARSVGRRWFATPAGRRLLAPEALEVIEREYLRFGTVGIFLARFLPGVRAVVPPFAGIANLSPARAIIPMALASAIWYGTITVLGSLVGARWETISRTVTQVNTTMAIVTAVVVVGLGLRWYLRWRRRRQERVWPVLQRVLGEPSEPVERLTIAPRDAALVVLELAYADAALTPADRAAVEAHLRERWGLKPPGRAPGASAGAGDELGTLRERIVRRFGQRQRIALVEGLWHAAFAGGAVDEPADRLLARAGELLGLRPEDVAEVRHRLRVARDAV